MSQQPHPLSSPARPHPFAGVPWSDYVRDAAAAVLLLGSLAMPWDAAHGASDRVEVVLVTLVSVLSLSAMYLHRTAVIPATVRPGTVALARALASAPYALVVTVYVAIDLVQALRNDGSVQGVGMAAAFGLAGAVLAAAPRASELALSEDPRAVSERWRRVVLAVGGVAVGWAALATLALLVRMWSGPFPLAEHLGAAQLLLLLVDPALVIASLVVLTLPAVRRSASGRVAAITASALYLGACVIDLLSGWEIQGGLETAGFSVPLATSVLALGAAYLAAPVRTAMVPAHGAALYLPAAAHVMLGFAVFGAVNVVAGLIGLLVAGAVTGALAAVLVLWAAACAALLAARAVLRRDPLGGRQAVMTLAGGVMTLGAIVLVIQALGGLAGMTQRSDLVILVGVPLALAVLLYAPPSVREYYTAAPAAPAAPAATPSTAPRPAAAAAVPQVPQVPYVDPALMAAVEHPLTDAATLHRIAAEAPWLRARVAAHPNAYPDLLAWLGALGDPAIDAALARRSG